MLFVRKLYAASVVTDVAPGKLTPAISRVGHGQGSVHVDHARAASPDCMLGRFQAAMVSIALQPMPLPRNMKAIIQSLFFTSEQAIADALRTRNRPDFGAILIRAIRLQNLPPTPAELLLREIPMLGDSDVGDAQACMDQRTGEPMVSFRFNTCLPRIAAKSVPGPPWISACGRSHEKTDLDPGLNRPKRVTSIRSRREDRRPPRRTSRRPWQRNLLHGPIL
jgi:hypothetical protein